MNKLFKHRIAHLFLFLGLGVISYIGICSSSNNAQEPILPYGALVLITFLCFVVFFNYVDRS